MVALILYIRSPDLSSPTMGHTSCIAAVRERDSRIGGARNTEYTSESAKAHQWNRCSALYRVVSSIGSLQNICRVLRTPYIVM